MAKSQGYIKIFSTLIYETEKSYLIHDGDVKAFIPKSLAKEFRKLNNRDEECCEMLVPDWLAVREGLV